MMIRWIELHIDRFFKLNGVLWLIFILLGLFSAYYLFGWPKNSMATWSDFQWYIVKHVWGRLMVDVFISLILCILFFMKTYAVFPCAALYLFSFLSNILSGIKYALEIKFMYLLPSASSFYDLVLLILAVIGTIIWARKVYFWFDKK